MCDFNYYTELLQLSMTIRKLSDGTILYKIEWTQNGKIFRITNYFHIQLEIHTTNN